VTIAARPRHSIRFRGRSFLAMVLAPEPPVADWLAEVDAWIERSPGFFVGRPVILDVSALPQEKSGITGLIADLHSRDIRIMGVQGADADLLGLGMPPVVTGGKQTGFIEVLEKGAGIAPDPEPTTLVLDTPVRSGQVIVHPKGDVVVVGSVASGAEVVAAGSIHVYGALRGRAIAGSTGNAGARIFCRKFEAELLAIDGLYKPADKIDPQLRGRAVQAWLDRNVIMMAALD
jgi:septum site-determining protein MinC